MRFLLQLLTIVLTPLACLLIYFFPYVCINMRSFLKVSMHCNKFIIITLMLYFLNLWLMRTPSSGLIVKILPR